VRAAAPAKPTTEPGSRAAAPRYQHLGLHSVWDLGALALNMGCRGGRYQPCVLRRMGHAPLASASEAPNPPPGAPRERARREAMLRQAKFFGPSFWAKFLGQGSQAKASKPRPRQGHLSPFHKLAKALRRGGARAALAYPLLRPVLQPARKALGVHISAAVGLRQRGTRRRPWRCLRQA